MSPADVTARMSPAQLAAWDALWRRLLAPVPDPDESPDPEPEDDAGDEDIAA